MRICFDLDGVITLGRYTHPLYRKCVVNEVVRDCIRKLKLRGHTIIIHTARHCIDRTSTITWLRKNGILWDELIMGKPLADVYVDDKALKFDSFTMVLWEELLETKDNQS